MEKKSNVLGSQANKRYPRTHTPNLLRGIDATKFPLKGIPLQNSRYLALHQPSNYN